MLDWNNQSLLLHVGIKQSHRGTQSYGSLKVKLLNSTSSVSASFSLSEKNGYTIQKRFCSPENSNKKKR